MFRMDAHSSIVELGVRFRIDLRLGRSVRSQKHRVTSTSNPNVVGPPNNSS